MKKLIAGIGALALALAFTGIASAATIDGVNDDSTASIVASWLMSIRIRNTNDAAITNTATATSGSGSNTIHSDDDQSNTSIRTGDASAAVVVENTANANDTSITLESPNAVEDPITNVTDESTATTDMTDEINDEEINENTVTVTNEVSATATSGDNDIHSEDSLDGGTVESGVTDSATGITNMFNFNVKDIIRAIRSSL